jgi:hypothetical protein
MIRGHYFHLRRELGKKKAFKAVKKIGEREKRVVNMNSTRFLRLLFKRLLKTIP